MIGMMDRRKFLLMGIGLIAAPAIVRATSLMPVRAWRPEPALYLMRHNPRPGFYGEGSYDIFGFDDFNLPVKLETISDLEYVERAARAPLGLDVVTSMDQVSPVFASEAQRLEINAADLWKQNLAKEMKYSQSLLSKYPFSPIPMEI